MLHTLIKQNICMAQFWEVRGTRDKILAPEGENSTVRRVEKEKERRLKKISATSQISGI